MSHQIFMERCLELAAKGFPDVMPNPMVGCVIVKDGIIIGEGFHTASGKPHAEVHAINSVADQSYLKDSTLYVNLEPCVHQGKTPPCADLIIDRKIPRVVIASPDPNPLVAGKGIMKLRQAGIEVETGVLEQESRELNVRFNCYHEKKRPYIILKYARSADGYFAPREKKQLWITNKYSRMLVHKWRGEEQAILVGKNTAQIDDPQLTNRFDSKPNPLRIVLDRKLELPSILKVFDNQAVTWIINEKIEQRDSQPQFIRIPFDENLLDNLMQELWKMDIQSLVVEGGALCIQSFIDQNLWDEARIFTGAVHMGEGIKAPQLNGLAIQNKSNKDDQLVIIRNK